jgi:hypothetical protein
MDKGHIYPTHDMDKGHIYPTHDMDQGHIYPLICMPGRGMKSPSLKGGMLNIQNRLYPRNILKKSHPPFYKDLNMYFKKKTC